MQYRNIDCREQRAGGGRWSMGNGKWPRPLRLTSDAKGWMAGSELCGVSAAVSPSPSSYPGAVGGRGMRGNYDNSDNSSNLQCGKPAGVGKMANGRVANGQTKSFVSLNSAVGALPTSPN